MDFSTRLRGINPTNTVFYSPEPHPEVYCLQMNFKISKLAYYLCQTKNRYKTPTTSLKVRPGNHKIFKCSAIELIESTNLLLDTWLSHSHKPKQQTLLHDFLANNFKQSMQSLEYLALQEAVTAYIYFQIKPILFVQLFCITKPWLDCRLDKK